MKAALVAALLASAPAAAEDCPTELGTGLRLVTADQRFTVEFRPGPDGRLHTTRRDTRPDTSIVFSYVESLSHDGLILDRVLAPVAFGNDFGGPVAPRAALESDGRWQAEAIAWIVPTGSPSRVDAYREAHDLTRTGTEEIVIGPCRYPTWIIDAANRPTEALAEPDRPLPAGNLRTLWYAPDLGVPLAFEELDADGRHRGVVRFATIAPLD